MSESEKMEQNLTINLPFPSEEFRDISYRVLVADKDPKNSKVRRRLEKVDSSSLKVTFTSCSLNAIGFGEFLSFTFLDLVAFSWKSRLLIFCKT